MNPSQYIQNELNNLRKTEDLDVSKDKISNFIFSKVTSKKFRKYALDEAMKAHIKQVVDNAVINNQPINFVWVFGGYKLWRIPSTPEVDWAELFSMIYFAKWLKPIVEAYKPGVVFDFYSDDVIVSRMNNIPVSDITAYLKSFKELLKYFQSFLPSNLKFTFHRVADQYKPGDFDKELEKNIIKLQSELPGGLPKIDEVRGAMVDLNVKLKPQQDQNDNWREKVLLIHDAYAMASLRRPYYRNEQKIMVLNTPVKGVIAVGTTKSSVAKFWCGMGVLEKRGEDYYEKILTPKQLNSVKVAMQPIAIAKLNSKNYSQIGII